MKNVKRILFLLLILVIVVAAYNYPKLNILAGYSAKNTASSIFLANRTLAFTDSTDNNFSPVNLASTTINEQSKSASASVYGLLTRKAIVRDGLGAVLTLDKSDETASYLSPKRVKKVDKNAFPYWDLPQKDSVFSNVDYTKLNTEVSSMLNQNKTRAILIIYKDKIIAEKYATGFTKESKLLGWSMTKSIVSTVYGVLQYQKKLHIKDKAPIASWQKDDRKHITISNLLQMNSGLEWDENYDEISDVTKMLFLERDMTKTQENKPLVAKPNTYWNYSSGTTNLLSGILRKTFATHQEYLDFWYTNLIDVIGMNSMLLEADLSGNYVGSSYAWASARDWAKFGLLYLHNGNWNGKELFTKDWVNYVTTPTPTSNGAYGAQFWLNANNQMKDAPKNLYYADGYLGQRIYILPDEDLVIVRLGLSDFDGNQFIKAILKTIQK